MSNLITIAEAARQGITKICQPQWMFPGTHVELALIDGQLGGYERVAQLVCPHTHKRTPSTPLRQPFVVWGRGNDRVWLPWEDEK